jgi:hypothetical protein
MPTTGQSPLSFVLLDRDDAVTGLDTLYVADDRAPSAGGGVQKWKSDGTKWTLVTTFTHDNAGAVLGVGMRGLAGTVSGNAVVLLATSADSARNRIFMYTDDGNNPNPTPALIATAAVNTMYRGIAFAP